MNDGALIQIIDAALAEAARKSGPWLVCRPGCYQCCIGPFEINQLDVRRLRAGLAAKEASDPDRAARVRTRAQDAVARLAPDFPGDQESGLLYEGEEAEERFASFANEEPCPVLDPATGTCDLYDSRPMTCRTFGPAAPAGPDSFGACELCYTGATSAEIAACAVEFDPDDLESHLNAELEESAGVHGRTIVAFCLG